MLATTALIGAVLVAFAVALINGRADRREAADQRFNDKAAVSSALITSLFDSSTQQQGEINAKDFGGAEIDPAKLEKRVKEGKLAYVVITDAEGKVVGASKGADESVLAALEEDPDHLVSALKGEPWAMSGLTKGGIAEYAAPFQSADGPRVAVSGFPIQLIAPLLGGTLAKLPNAARERAYISDGSRVLSSAKPDIKIAEPEPKAGKDRAETRAGVDRTPWRVVLSQREADLYKGVSSPVQWLILVALGIAGLIALLLLRRAMRQSADLQVAYAGLEGANAELERTNVELQRSNGELEQFASVASHDLQEPLRKVQTFGDQLERRFGDDLTDEAKDYLRRMRNASARMSVLIDDLLRFSRVTTHAKPHVAVDLNRVARDVLMDLEARVDETNGKVELGELPKVTADPTQMRQLLQNLIGNALKFHRPGVPPVVRVETAGHPRDGMVAISVSDNGIGFESTYEERIFRVFERLHPRDVYAGTGIGLALCRKIAERHGGTISGDGRPDEGATFTVVLPVAESAATVARTAPEPVHA